MRGLRTIINQFRLSKGATLAVGVFMLSVAFGGFGLLNTQSASASGNDIVNGGIWNRDLASKCHGDVKTIMDHYRIDCNLAGAVDGHTCRDGNVYIGDRIVARDAQSIGRHNKQGDHPISIGGQTYYEGPNSSTFLQECLDTFVKLDQHGSFVYAIIKACGNPIWSPSPVVVTPPPPAPPAPKNIKVCELSTKKIITIKESEFSSSWHTKNLELCKETPKTMQVCVLASKEVKTIKEAEFDSKLHSKNLDDCKEKETPKPITVCDLTTHKMISIEEKDFNSTKHSKNPADCEMCAHNPELPKDSTECVPPPALPQTGGADSLLGAGLGIGSTIIAGSFYAASRRDLLSAFLAR